MFLSIENNQADNFIYHIDFNLRREKNWESWE